MSTMCLGKLSGMSDGKVMQGVLLAGAGVLGLTAGLIAIQQHGLSSYSRYVRIVYAMLLVTHMCAVLRGFSFHRKDLFTLIGNPIGLWSYTLPLLMVVGGRLSSWRLLHVAIRRQCIIGMLMFSGCVIFLPGWVLRCASSPKGMFYGAGFILLLWRHEKHAVRVVAGVALLLAALGNLLIELSRTNLMWCMLNCLCVWVVLGLADNDKILNIVKRSFAVVFISVLITGSLWLFLSPLPLVRNGMDNFSDKLHTDSRTSLVQEFFSDVQGLDLVIGRGALGTYWSQYFDFLDSIGQRADDAYRDSFEIGYLHIILKGGIVMLLLFLLLTVPAGVWGLFASRNDLVRACGGTVLITLVVMFLAWVPLSGPHFVLFWLCVGACLSGPLRNASDDDVGLWSGDDNMSLAAIS